MLRAWGHLSAGDGASACDQTNAPVAHLVNFGVTCFPTLTNFLGSSFFSFPFPFELCDLSKALVSNWYQRAIPGG